MDAQTLLEFIHEIGKLKVLPRTGWLLRGVKEAESIAEHAYRTSLLVMVLADVLVEHGVALDTTKVMRMALLHDIGESQISDIPYPAILLMPTGAKEHTERAAIHQMLSGLGAVGQQYIALWEEFEARETLEAQLVNAADKLEMMIQAFEYEKTGYKSLNDFWANTANFRGFDMAALIQDVMTLLTERRDDLLSR